MIAVAVLGVTIVIAFTVFLVNYMSGVEEGFVEEEAREFD